MIRLYYTDRIKMKKRVSILITAIFFILIIISSSSCVTHRQLVMLQSGNDQAYSAVYNFNDRYLLQSGDILHIKVSSLDQKSVEIFNKSVGSMQNSNLTSSNLYIFGYTVDSDGNIRLPLIGDLKVDGFSIDSTRSLITESLSSYFKHFTVDVKLVNYRVSILGEVANPGTQFVYNMDNTIYHAISQAGGPTTHANLKKVKLIRHEVGGTKMYTINLSDNSLLDSSFAHVLPGDVYYLEPKKSKATQHNVQLYSLVISTLSLTVILINSFRN